MNWFKKLLPSKIKSGNLSKRKFPEGIWKKCESCKGLLYSAELERGLGVCPKCGYHMRISARQRLKFFLDSEMQEEFGQVISPIDSLKFKDSKKYKDRLVQAKKKTDESDALVAIKGKLKSQPLICVAFDFGFMGGSMGSVVGERFVLAAEAAAKNHIPLVCFSASGGARMQEALFSLMQMAKTSSALAMLRRNHIPYISVLTDPTMGGVSASLAMLGDINIAEPGALIGFAGPRVIQQTVKEVLPDNFQKSEFLLEHGMIDMIIDRREMRNRIASILSTLTQNSQSVLNAS